MKIWPTALKLGAFVVTMIFVLTGLIVVFGQIRFDSTRTFSAEFTSASGLKAGQFVRIAGVEAGKVSDVSVTADGTAMVDFEVDTTITLTNATQASVRYQNLIGDRYLELKAGAGDPQPLEVGDTIPMERTSPALDLDELLGGFRPLFRALDPAQINVLTNEIVQVFQGQGGTIGSLVSRTASLTSTLADRDELIGSVVTNLNTVLGTLNQQQDQFGTTIDQLQKLVSGLSGDADPIAKALGDLTNASTTVAGLLNEARPPLQETIAQTGRVSANVNARSEYVDSVLGQLPTSYQKLAALGSYGDFFNFYICDLKFTLNGADGNPIEPLDIKQDSGRCTPP